MDEHLTNEGISTKYRSQFDMVNEAIKLVVSMVHSGRGARIKINSKNPAVVIPAEIRAGKAYLEDLPAPDAREIKLHIPEQKGKMTGSTTFKTNTLRDQ